MTKSTQPSLMQVTNKVKPLQEMSSTPSGKLCPLVVKVLPYRG